MILKIPKKRVKRKKIKTPGFKKDHIPWNKGLTKETDERVKKYSKKVSISKKGMRLTEEHKKNISIGLNSSEKFQKSIKSLERGEKISKSLVNYYLVNKGPFSGKHHTNETKQKQSKLAIERFKDPEERKKLSEAVKKAVNKPEARENFLKAMKSLERSKKISDANKKRYEDPKEREKTSKAMKEVWLSPILRESQSRKQKERYEDPKEREKTSKAMKEVLNKPEVREKMSKSGIERYKDPKEREIIKRRYDKNARKR